jgi:hypothetical protein
MTASPPPDSMAPHGGYGDLSHPHGVYAASVARTYFAMLSVASGDVEVAYYDHATATTSAPVVVTAALDQDLHASPAILRRPDGYLVVFYTSHNDSGLRLKVSTNPDDTSSWQAERNIAAEVGGLNYTYPMPSQLLDLPGDPTFYFIRSDTGRRGHDNPMWAYSKTTDANLQTATWAAQVVLYQTVNQGGYLSANKTSESRIDFCVTSDAPGFATNPIHLGHFYFDGTDYHATDGTVITGLPLDFPDVTEVYHAASGPHDEWCSPGKVALGIDGYPRIAFPVLLDDYDIVVKWARWTGSAWDVQQVCDGQWSGGSDPKSRGGIAIDPADPNAVYVARRVADQTEIEKFVTADNGASWTEYPITVASAARQSMPFVPTARDNSLRVLWQSSVGTRGSAI